MAFCGAIQLGVTTTFAPSGDYLDLMSRVTLLRRPTPCHETLIRPNRLYTYAYGSNGSSGFGFDQRRCGSRSEVRSRRTGGGRRVPANSHLLDPYGFDQNEGFDDFVASGRRFDSDGAADLVGVVVWKRRLAAVTDFSNRIRLELVRLLGAVVHTVQFQRFTRLEFEDGGFDREWVAAPVFDRRVEFELCVMAVVEIFFDFRPESRIADVGYGGLGRASAVVLDLVGTDG